VRNSAPKAPPFASSPAINPPRFSREKTSGCDVVVNLVAILAERTQTFEETIHQGALNIATAAQKAGVPHFVQISALGANASSPSAYARAKANAEAAVLATYPKATIIRPSLVMDPTGGFVRQINLLTRFSPFMVLPGRGQTRFQPVELHTLAQQIAKACLQPDASGSVQNAVGPQILTFRQLASQELAKLQRRRIFLPLPWGLTSLVAQIMSVADILTLHRLIPYWLLVTPDQVTLLKKDNIASR
jgi:uncharacterized protein YbjT (DUF2867 family)